MHMSDHYPKLLHLSSKKSSRILPLKANGPYPSALFSVDKAPHLYWPSHTCKFSILILNTYLVLSWDQEFTQLLSPSKLQHPLSSLLNKDEDPFTNRDLFLENNMQRFSIYLYAGDEVSASKGNAVKRHQQWARWKNKVIPLLMELYLALLNQTCNLHNLSSSPLSWNCICIGNWKLKVLCLYFDYKYFTPSPVASPDYALLLDII